jgi:hypothetical protein
VTFDLASFLAGFFLGGALLAFVAAWLVDRALH